MTEVRFFHLTRTSLEAALPQLLEKTLERSQRAVVMAGSEERVEALTAHLWSFSDQAFLPHGSRRDGNAEDQPIWLTVEDEAPNGATVLFLTDGATSLRIASYERCAILFDGNDPAAVSAARAQWSQIKGDGHELSYWQQNERGGWQQKQ